MVSAKQIASASIVGLLLLKTKIPQTGLQVLTGEITPQQGMDWVAARAEAGDLTFPVLGMAGTVYMLGSPVPSFGRKRRGGSRKVKVVYRKAKSRKK